MKYWYKFYYTECVLCGCCMWKVKERQHTSKPNDRKLRYEFSQDACYSHFL